MRDKSDELALMIARIKRLVSEGLDPLTTERLEALVQELEARALKMQSLATSGKKREADGINKRSEWRVGQRVSRKDSIELGVVTEVNGQIKVKWDGGRTSVFKHGDTGNVELTGRE